MVSTGTLSDDDKKALIDSVKRRAKAREQASLRVRSLAADRLTDATVGAVMAAFPFEEAARIMAEMNWRWGGRGDPKKGSVPTADQLRVEMLELAATARKYYGYCACGGLVLDAARKRCFAGLRKSSKKKAPFLLQVEVDLLP